MRTAWPLLAAALIVGAGKPAHADGVHQHAVAAFEHARKLIEAGDCAGAIEKLDESIRYEPSIGAHLSYADCLEKSDPHSAYRHLRDAAVIARAKGDQRLDVAEQRSRALAPQIAAVQIEVDPADLATPGFLLKVDELAIDRFHLTAPIAAPPGDHTLSATTASGKRWLKRVRTDAGRVIGVKVVLEDPPPPPVAPPVPVAPVAKDESARERPASTRATIGLVVTGVGVATLLTGAAFGIVTLTKRGELDRVCNGDASRCTGPPRNVDPVLDSAEKNATASTILLSAGGVLVVSGIVLWLTAPRSTPTTTARLRRGAFTW
jgi:hypothetical protein